MTRRSPALVSLLVLFAVVGCDESTCEVACDAGVASDSGGGAVDAALVDAGAGVLCGAACDAVIVDAAWLADRLTVTDLTVLDVRSESAFSASHVPGARWIDGGALRATVDGVGGQVAPQADLQAAFRAAGLDRDHAIVVMGDDTGTGSARVFWTLEYAGHARVLFLDGGWSAWMAAGGSVEAGASAADPTEYTIDALDADRRVDADWVRDNLADSDVMLVDARTSGEYDGGHVLNAVHVNWTDNVESGALRPEAEVLALYPGLDLAATTGVAYCQTGSRASVAYLVLRWLGVADARLYDGSWAEWSTLDAGEYLRGP
ncbi:MAG: sulfurtransferase [Sandaracinaceae bacterium]